VLGDQVIVAVVVEHFEGVLVGRGGDQIVDRRTAVEALGHAGQLELRPVREDEGLGIRIDVRDPVHELEVDRSELVRVAGRAQSLKDEWTARHELSSLHGAGEDRDESWVT
jgi:hypothetical protein